MPKFRRTELAEKMAQQLLNPGPLDEGLRSGLFLSGPRRTGKTTFLMNDLVPELREKGAIVIYVDLWSNTAEDPAKLVHAAIKETLHELSAPGSDILQQLKRIRGLDLGAAGFKFGFKLDALGSQDGSTLANALMEVVDQAKTSVVLIIDEVQHAITSDEGGKMLYALKAARDQINLRPGTPGYFVFVGTGSHRARINELSAQRNQAFNGANTVDFPVLDADFVEYTLKRVAGEFGDRLPSKEVAVKAFETLGNRPEELVRALRILKNDLPAGGAPDLQLPVVAATLRTTAADGELQKLINMGQLACAIFSRVCTAGGQQPKLFTAAAAAAYSAELGRTVAIEEIQPVVNQMVSENLLMRRGHGWYGVTDPFTQQVWLESNPPTLAVDPESPTLPSP